MDRKILKRVKKERDRQISKRVRAEYQVVCRNTVTTYESIMAMERLMDDKSMLDGDMEQWKKIMVLILRLMLATDADDMYLDKPEKMKEYDQMLQKYLGMKTPSSHS